MVILDVHDNPLYLVHDHICYNIKQYRFSFVQAELGSNISKYPKLGSLLGRPPSIGKAGGPIVLSSGSNISNTSHVDVSESTAIKRKRSSTAGEVLSSKKSRISGKCLMSVPVRVIIMNFHINNTYYASQSGIWRDSSRAGGHIFTSRRRVKI